MNKRLCRVNDVVDNNNAGMPAPASMNDDGTMKVMVKYIDKRFTGQGKAYYAETAGEDIPDQVNWWNHFALCLVRHMDPSNQNVVKTGLQVNSQRLKDILKTTIASFPGVSFQTKEVTIEAPFRVLYHYRTELRQVQASLAAPDQEEASKHLQLLLDFIDEQFRDTIDEVENLRPQGMITYQNLWAICRPGCTVYTRTLGQARAFSLVSYAYQCTPAGNTFHLTMKHVDFDGQRFGTRAIVRAIDEFMGAEGIARLTTYPIEYHEAPEALKRGLIERGRRFEALAGIHFQSYQGVALEELPNGRGWARYSIDGRVVVDTKTHHRLNAGFAFTVGPLKAEGSDAQTHGRADALTDEQALVASGSVRGFSFGEKRWLDFFVDQCSPIAWDAHCFDRLVLPETQKDLVQALVANHTQPGTGFDDIVKGKGKGLVLVLHGPPGVGKTLTAETVAEYCKRPLYVVSSGDLGTKSETLDERLTRILDMASTWRAVLLIDEADVFLERRSLRDLERNSLVSIFLRVLEYYEGILFLTSNRVETFDDAFKSRIHVPLKYNELTVESRKAIWKNFLEKPGEDGVQMGEAEYDHLAQAELNGRQIKNVIGTAKSLAQFHGQKLDQKTLQQVIRIQNEFEQELRGVDDGVVVNAM